ncbi:TPA: 16S rRNA (cytosine(1407)-C(5))-methyltransferase RsmF [Vibrio parahaemolyticus]|uniref:16S rRNA (cytosine(1407)-C(5))-methyltransferase RsmF n=1 Tax=Vibrio parahaemolyticus TaxID=670 RepID=UPI002269BEEE|nr:16S rRNA (cytosine(1407)-C(5))-methyltransferase RsmF [Vibrio parahaemolyticus]MCX8859080.1 16S rRNA (cytosine(1407)-C(5))-methyltransferase RsmF [Vibrio parahaemolyticus]MCX8864535.1 16S rRNA (cytosine(1407)-C(5))-methyltransferase RsmF [Vibrio parahaemolyticus]MCX8870048.1 16S rRNA (cytosine(1407)-C(5))-methyltransferase RsmF [Vibrio parahaemolyticus]MCX8899672.1 16S rRNA (cytosine(1407)-C(5))-methyltransferase RsmF [Vibrio parahaemolyticus]MCX8919696.1 16S rRNA (cytosine(1407)-C(5))-meth
MHPNVYIPDAFLEKIQTILPANLNMEDFISACQRPLRKSIRVNTLKMSVEDFVKRADDKGWTLSPVPWCDNGFWIEADESVVPLGNTAEHMSGLFYIQEASSMMPVSALFMNDESYDAVLDTAAAPGSKTTQIAALMKNEGVLVANEYAASRVKVLHANIERCGVRNAALSNFDGRVFGGWLPEQFDAVLLDAPCSGEGTVRKDEDAMKNWTQASVLEIADTQKDLIESAFHALKPGGVLVYSTCTLSTEENQQVCHHLKETFGDAVEFESLDGLFENANAALTEEGFLHIFPQVYDCEGFFVARIRKHHSSVEAPQVKKRMGKFPFVKASKKESEEISKQLHNALDIELPSESTVWLRDKDVWLFPDALEPMIGELRFSRMGIKIAEAHKNGYRWQHQVATALATGAESNAIELTIEEAREWYMGRDVRPQIIPEGLKTGKGEVLVKYQGAIIGLGKWVSNRIKNGLPRELVRDKNLF